MNYWVWLMNKKSVGYKTVTIYKAYLLLLFAAAFLWPLMVQGASPTQDVIAELDKSMVEIPAGEFTMGTDRGEVNERPAHTVYLDTYYISRFEIANRQYRSFLNSTNFPQPFFWNNWRWNGDNYPVIGVSWKDAQAFCGWLTKMTGQIWRLPTEAEWEKAASWVEKEELKQKFPWGEDFKEGLVNIIGNEDGYQRTAPIDSFKDGTSPYGIYHLADNVAEWCLDWFENDYYANSPSENPKGPEEGSLKSVRGGEWKSSKLMIQNTFRKGDWPNSQYNYIGFRVVRIPQK